MLRRFSGQCQAARVLFCEAEAGVALVFGQLSIHLYLENRR
jgi:hypothetical protein